MVEGKGQLWKSASENRGQGYIKIHARKGHDRGGTRREQGSEGIDGSVTIGAGNKKRKKMCLTSEEETTRTAKRKAQTTFGKEAN